MKYGKRVFLLCNPGIDYFLTPSTADEIFPGARLLRRLTDTRGRPPFLAAVSRQCRHAAVPEAPGRGTSRTLPAWLTRAPRPEGDVGALLSEAHAASSARAAELFSALPRRLAMQPPAATPRATKARELEMRAALALQLSENAKLDLLADRERDLSIQFTRQLREARELREACEREIYQSRMTRDARDTSARDVGGLVQPTRLQHAPASRFVPSSRSPSRSHSASPSLRRFDALCDSRGRSSNRPSSVSSLLLTDLGSHADRGQQPPAISRAPPPPHTSRVLPPTIDLRAGFSPVRVATLRFGWIDALRNDGPQL